MGRAVGDPAVTDTGGWAAVALSGARPAVFWTDRRPAAPAGPPLKGTAGADLVIVGGGFTGLWAALAAVERSPGRRVVLLEAETVGFGASGRNGGFADSSLTHGLGNGVAHWPDEIADLVRIGRENLSGLVADVGRLGIDGDLTPSGELSLADAPWQAAELAEAVDLHHEHGLAAEYLDAAAVQGHLRSPRFVAGMYRPDDVVLVDPARLALGLRDAVEAAGVTVHDDSPVRAIDDDGQALVVRSDAGRVQADRVLVATNAYRGPVPRTRRWIVPVYDHVLMTEPLSGDQLASVGWSGREGASDAANRFHYFRLTDDDRVLWGGFEPTYHRGNGLDPAHDQDDDMHALLARHFFETFPQLEGVRFSHRWGGPIGTTSRFSATWGSKHDGRLVWVGGYTGLGVAASRFGAATALDLVDGLSTERTGLEMVQRRPVPFPPEPLRSVAIAVTQRAVRRADERDGRQGLWLRTLDRFGVGLDF
jgi:glycine/D-amino acid oxidase-like deaminating enzyme